MELSQVSYLFNLYGEICTKFPWETIVFTITLTACMFSIDFDTNKNITLSCSLQDYSLIDTIIMGIIGSLAVLNIYYQFRNIKELGSTYIFNIAVLFTFFSSLAFTCTILFVLQFNFTCLKDALFLFFLLTDLSKVMIFARLALGSSNKCNIRNNIVQGLEIIGPKITMDTILETLIIGIGMLSDDLQLQTLSYFACTSIIIDYLVFMTFYLSSLLLILELSRKESVDQEDDLYTKTFLEYNKKINPITQIVKIIMLIGLLGVHLYHVKNQSRMNTSNILNELTSSDYVLNYSLAIRWSKMFNNQGVALVILYILFIKFLLTKIHLKCNIKKIMTNKKIQAGNCCVAVRKYPVAANSAKLEALTDNEIVEFVLSNNIPMYLLENYSKDAKHAVVIRKKVLTRLLNGTNQDILNSLPLENFNYEKLIGACCENVIGYVPVPLGIVGPLKLDDDIHYVPMATTEGCLVASVMRGCKAVSLNGINSQIINDGMARGPVVRFPMANHAVEAMSWVENNFELLKEKFDSTSSYARLTKLTTRIAGRYLYIRFVAKTGDAMGMNMLSVATEKSLKYMQEVHPNMEVLSLSGNFCCDKKPAYVNWLEGRGKSVVCEAIVPSHIVKTVLKTTVQRIVEVNIAKNLVGSAIAGTIGGNNAHAANVVTAIFIATGQDPAQNVVSSNCTTLMEACGDNGENLHVSCTMPSIEVATVGGGTILLAQSTCLDILGVKGGNVENPGENASRLAKIVCATVLAGELSLIAALSAGHLVESHLRHNRSAN